MRTTERVSSCRQGFTLIEIIGVLAIIAILATAIVPNLSHQVTIAMADSEDASLQGIADAIKLNVKDTHVITADATWNAILSAPNYLEIPAANILSNAGANGTRRLIFNPSWALIGAGVYNQGTTFTAGAAPLGNLPVAAQGNAQLLLVSNLAGPVAATVLTGGAGGTFQAVWDQTAAAPAGFTQTEMIRIQRITLSNLFHQVTINITNLPGGTPNWGLDGGATRPFAANGAYVCWLLEGTRVALGIPGVVGNIIITGPKTFTYNGTTSTWTY